MKKFYLILSVLTISLTGLQAQSWTFENGDSTDMAVALGDSTQEVNLDNEAMFSAADTTPITWRITTLNLPAGWDASYCDDVDCLTNISTSTNSSFTANATDTLTWKAQFYPFENAGTAELVARLVATGSPNLVQNLYYKASVGATSLPTISTGSFGIYPNPFNTKLVMTKTGFSSLEVEVTDILGKTVYLHDWSASDKLEINTAQWSKGLYMARITDHANQRVYVEKIQK